MIRYLAQNQNWAKVTPLLGVIATITLFKYTNINEPIFWALVNIPMYLFHQMEEHFLPGGFKNYVNQKMNQGIEKLNDIKVFWINIIVVWFTFIIFGILSCLNIAFGFAIIIFSVINCLAHIIMAIKQKEWNPGLCMATVQFILSIYAAWYISINGNIAHILLWWIGMIAFSIITHIVIFKVSMTRN